MSALKIALLGPPEVEHGLTCPDRKVLALLAYLAAEGGMQERQKLTRLLPELRERYPDLPPLTINGTFASSRLFEALARLSQALASQAPLLMFVDDMQWTDAATLDVFQYLARYWTEHETPAMLLLSRRTETRAMEPEMSEWLASLGSSISLTRLEAASAPSVSPSGYWQKRRGSRSN